MTLSCLRPLGLLLHINTRIGSHGNSLQPFCNKSTGFCPCKVRPTTTVWCVQVEGLRGELLELMITNIDTENAAAFALLADDYGITALHDASVTFASTTSNKLAVAGSESFLKLMTARPQLAQKFITGVMASEDMPSKRSATKLGKRKRK